MAPIIPLDDQAQTRLAMAALFVALVRALEKRDLTSRAEVSGELEKLYREVRDYPAQSLGVIETLRWADELLKV
jgi:hypothetical protein